MMKNAQENQEKRVGPLTQKERKNQKSGRERTSTGGEGDPIWKAKHRLTSG